MAGRYAERLYFHRHTFFDQFDCLKRTVDLLGKNQRGIFRFPLAVSQRTVLEVFNRQYGADRDRRNKQQAARDEISDRAVAPKQQPDAAPAN